MDAEDGRQKEGLVDGPGGVSGEKNFEFTLV